jgi:hypothetical protein
MIRDTNYHPDWQNVRIDYIRSLYNNDFFKGKRVLELGAYNGYIGSHIKEMGADVHCIEGRQDNVDRMKNWYPTVTVEQADLDRSDWIWGKWDVIINFGLFYHLETFHKEHLVNCINNCDLMLFETVIYDTPISTLASKEEQNTEYDDQSLTGKAGIPSTKYVEDIFKECGVDYKKIVDGCLNAKFHSYDWEDSHFEKPFNPTTWQRRFWIVKNK